MWSLIKHCAFLLDQFDMLQEYFLVYLPSIQRKNLQNNTRYANIKEVLTSSMSKIRLNFILFLCRSIFDGFLTWFQKEGPLIHLLYSELSDLYRTILLCFLSAEHVGSTTGGALLDIDFKLAEKQLPTKKLQIGKLKLIRFQRNSDIREIIGPSKTFICIFLYCLLI
jgi:hypothetical protein